MNKKPYSILFLIICFVVLLLLSACQKNSGDAVYVQSVAAINNMGSIGINNRFAGVTVSGTTQEVFFDKSMTLDKILVEAGQSVKAGDTLFTYNDDALKLTIEQMELEIESMKNSIAAYKDQINELTKERSRVSDSEKLRYTLEIQGLEADIRETEYNMKTKEAELKNKRDFSVDAKVTSEINGKVTEVNKLDEYDNLGQEKPFIVIVESDNLRIKGTINEMNHGSLTEGQRVAIHSRVDDSIWYGVVAMIDWSATENNNNPGYYYPTDEMSTSSKYPFYIDVDNPEGLMIGQHVYIELAGNEINDDAIRIPAYFINDTETDPWVWVSNKHDKLEKRQISLGDFNEELFEYIVENGLSAEDYIAFPQEGLKSGMRTTKTQEPEENNSDMQDNGAFLPGENSESYYEDETAMSDDNFEDSPEAIYEGAAITGGEEEPDENAGA